MMGWQSKHFHNIDCFETHFRDTGGGMIFTCHHGVHGHASHHGHTSPKHPTHHAPARVPHIVAAHVTIVVVLTNVAFGVVASAVAVAPHASILPPVAACLVPCRPPVCIPPAPTHIHARNHALYRRRHLPHPGQARGARCHVRHNFNLNLLPVERRLVLAQGLLCGSTAIGNRHKMSAKVLNIWS